MSKNEKKALEPEHEEHQKNSVYDFLYNDTRRVGAFLSQFDDAGLLEKHIQHEGASRGGAKGWKASVGGSVFGAGSAQVYVENGPKKGGFEAAERVYDPLWQNSLSLLDFLADRDMLVREDVSQARMGQFVLLSGKLSLYDLELLHKIWDEPFVKEKMKSRLFPDDITGNRQERRTSQKKNRSQSKEIDDNINGLLSFMNLLPHLIQVNLACHNNKHVWGTLSEMGMVGSTADLFLKHGVNISGKWFILGVLDALPHDKEGTNLAADENIGDLSPLTTLLRDIAKVSSSLGGKPPGHYGVTPLMIFREVLN